MAHRSLATRIWGHAASALRRHPPPGHLGPGVPLPPAAYALRRHPAPGHLSPGVPAAAALYRFVGTTRGQNDITIREIAIRRTPFDVQRIRDEVKRYKIEDEIMRENLSWTSRYYKTMEWYCYVALSVSTSIVIACEVVVRSRKDKGHLEAGLICDL